MKDLLSNNEEVVSFDWIRRENVVRGVANALSYMHISQLLTSRCSSRHI